MVKDLMLVLQKSMKKTLNTLRNNPLSILLPFLTQILFAIIYLLNPIFAYTGIIGGFILAIIYAGIISIIYSQYNNLILYNRFSKVGISFSFSQFFIQIYSIYFLLMIVRILSFSTDFKIAIFLVLYIFFNPLQETLYLEGRQSLDAVSYCGRFMRENFIYWLIPLIIYIAINYLLLGGQEVLLSITRGDIVDQIKGFSNFNLLNLSTTLTIPKIISSLITGLYMIYRGHLFLILSTSTRRKREYMGSDLWN